MYYLLLHTGSHSQMVMSMYIIQIPKQPPSRGWCPRAPDVSAQKLPLRGAGHLAPFFEWLKISSIRRHGATFDKVTAMSDIANLH